MTLSNLYSPFCINGVIHSDPIKCSILSPSFQYGLTVFEGIRCYMNNSHTAKPFLLQQHLDRLLQSAQLLGFRNIDIELVNADIKHLLSSWQPTENCYIKYILGYLGEGSWSSMHDVDRVCFGYPLASNLLNASYQKSCFFSSYRRINDNSLSPFAKCGANYINSRLGFLESQDHVSDLPIFLDENGYVSESSGSCLFALKDRTILTPPLHQSVLPSITRDIVISFISKSFPDYTFCESTISRSQLLVSDEIFLVGTNVEILPITRLQNFTYPSFFSRMLQQTMTEFIYA